MKSWKTIKKIKRIEGLNLKIVEGLKCFKEIDGRYCSFGQVIDCMEQALDILENHQYQEKPEGRFEGLPYSTALNHDDVSVPREYKGDMSIEDYEEMCRMAELYGTEEEDDY